MNGFSRHLRYFRLFIQKIKSPGRFLAVCCLSQLCIFNAFSQSETLAEESADPGAYAYSRGDYSGAANIWLIEAYEGSAEAQFNLGVMYLEGKGVPQNRESAIFWFNEAAKADYVEAQYNLGHLLVEDRGNADAVRVGVQWWARAAVLGYPIAQFNYGLAYFHGFGVAKDLAACKYWMEKSASAGESVASKFLGEHIDVLSTLDPLPSAEDLRTFESMAGPDNTDLSDTATSIAKITETEPGTQSSSDVEIDYRIVTSGTAFVFISDSPDSAILAELDKNTLVRVRNHRSGWFYVELPGGVPGWLETDADGEVGDFVQTEESGVTAFATARLSKKSELGRVEGNQFLLVLDTDSNSDRFRVLLPEYIGGWIPEQGLVRVLAPDSEIADLWLSQSIGRKQSLLVNSEKPLASADTVVNNADQTSTMPNAEITKGTNLPLKSSTGVTELTVDEFVSSLGTDSASSINANVENDIADSADLVVRTVNEQEGIVTSNLEDTDAVEIDSSDIVESETLRFIDQVFPDSKNRSTGIRNDNHWLFGNPASAVTFQLLSERNEASAREYLENLGGWGQLFSTTVEGVKWYFILYGSYESSEAAESFRSDLPVWAQSGVIRSFEFLQDRRCKSAIYLDEQEKSGLEEYCRI